MWRSPGAIEPSAFLELSDAELRAIGFSRQKAGYARDLAGALADGFDLEGLADLPDDEVRSSLMRLRGIGRWTADIYLIMCLRRPDVWPHGDQALATAARELLELPAQPTFDALELRARSWRPHRATAARILWHHYLSVRGRSLRSGGYTRGSAGGLVRRTVVPTTSAAAISTRFFTTNSPSTESRNGFPSRNVTSGSTMNVRNVPSICSEGRGTA